MSVLLQVSDPHFGTEQPPVCEALRRLVRSQAPDVLLLSGDITQRARPAEFRAARVFVDALGVPQVLAVPGNHDIPLFDPFARLLRPYAHYRKAFGAVLEPVFESAGLLVLSVNTTRAWRHKDGEVSSAQVERIAARLAAARPAQLRLVMLHHPVAVTLPRDERNLLHGHAEAVRRWAAAGADLVLGGHIHLPYVLPLHEHRSGLARPVWAVQAGTAVSSRVRPDGPNSVNVIRSGHESGPRRCVIERWDYRGPDAGFECVHAESLQFAEALQGG